MYEIISGNVGRHLLLRTRWGRCEWWETWTKRS